jgi:hypothetical protein
MNKYITVVFEYSDGSKLPQELSLAFSTGGQYKDTVITAMSLKDEISELDKLELALDD